MAITLGTFTKSPAGFTGTLKTERRDLCEPQTRRP